MLVYINGTVHVLCKTRLIFPRINGPIVTISQQNFLIKIDNLVSYTELTNNSKECQLKFCPGFLFAID